MRGFFAMVLLLVLTSAQAWAGGAVSSGGGSFGDDHNPWFLRNVASATYCLNVDSATFSAGIDDIRADVQQAIAYWQQQFTAVQTFDSVGVVKIATQSFSEVDCTDNPDVEIVLGYGGLTPDQLTDFTDPGDPTVGPTSYIGCTMRTSYDAVNMRGKGYIYISSDMGAHIYYNDGNLIAPAWTKPNLLLYALIHEWGHVFGFPHTGSSIMSEVFLEQILDQNLTYIFQQADIMSFLLPGPTVDDKNIVLSAGAAQWFAAPAGTTAIRVQLQSGTTMPVYAYTQAPGTTTPPTPTQIGSFMGIDVSTLTDMRSSPGIFVHLEPGQTLFTQQEAGFRGFMLGPSFLDFGAQANYVPSDGSGLKPAYLRVTSDSVTVLGMVPSANKMGVMFSYESPVDIMVTQPPNPPTQTQDAINKN